MMSKMEVNLDKTLALLYQRSRMNHLDLHSINTGIEDIDGCLTYLASNDYIKRTLIMGSDATFHITPKGKTFHENGGYAALRTYNQEILKNSRSTLFFAKYGFWVAIISMIVGIISLFLAFR